MTAAFRALLPLACACVFSCGDHASSPGGVASVGPYGVQASRARVVGEHHNGPARSGLYIEPTFSRANAANFHRDLAFDGAVNGAVYAQPLYMADGPAGRAAVFVATEANVVTALDAITGAPIWTVTLGPPSNRMTPACPSYNPLGITGTPYLDAASRTLFVDAVSGVGEDGQRDIGTHLVHALSVDDGSERSGWPVDLAGVKSNGVTFDPSTQHQRGALLAAKGMLYVPFGSFGDCGNYHGWVMAISLDAPHIVTGWATPAAAAGVWAPSGVSSDGESIFFATGNSNTSADDDWGGGEAVLRFPAGVPLSDTPSDYFAPSDWRSLDMYDVDLGGSGALLVDVPGAKPEHLVVALGKDGNAYVLDAAHLGGEESDDAQAISETQVSTENIVTSAATFATDKGVVVVLDAQTVGVGKACPSGEAGDLVGLLISAAAPPTVSTLWCAGNAGHGSPVVTTMDGRSEPIVWVSSDFSGELHAFDAMTGDLLFSGDGDPMPNAHRFSTLLIAGGRIYAATDGRVYAYSP